jgi:UDP-2,3-diacylglucosamine pyrophosphatase LpxH
VTIERHYRTVFISDVHLGSKHSKANKLLTFLQSVHCDTLFLVGDLFDSPGIALPVEHKLVLEHILRRSSVTTIIYVPGNHDKIFRDLTGQFANMEIVLSTAYILANGKTMLITHGDEWDWIDTGPLLHLIDRKLPYPLWECGRVLLKGFMRRHVAAFEKRALKARNGYDMILCGHVHQPALKEQYANAGDWVKHCTAIVEHWDGQLELLRFTAN